MAEFKSVRQLTKKAAERARNSCWSSRVVEAERLAQRAERSGRGGSLTRELRLLGSSIPKASTSPLFSTKKTPLINDEEKLQRWSEHFASVVNSCSTVTQLTLESLPVVNPLMIPNLLCLVMKPTHCAPLCLKWRSVKLCFRQDQVGHQVLTGYLQRSSHWMVLHPSSG